MTGLQAVAGRGTIGNQVDATLTPSGLSATASLGSVTAVDITPVAVTGLQATTNRGTINVTSENEFINSPFEIKTANEEEEQEIINTISQDNFVAIEEQEIVLVVLPEGEEKIQYEYAMSILKQGDYELAQKAFQEFLTVANDNSLLSNANFWIAETFYVRENYKEAAKNYLNLYQVYPDSKKAAHALLKLGISLVNMDQKEQGCVTFIQLKDTYPNANIALLNRGNLEIEKNGCEIS